MGVVGVLLLCTECIRVMVQLVIKLMVGLAVLWCFLETVMAKTEQEKGKSGGADGEDKNQLSDAGDFDNDSIETVKGKEARNNDNSGSVEAISECGLLGIGVNSVGIGENDGKEEGEMVDDWEGIERSELEKSFGEAVIYVSHMSNADQIDGDVKLQLYGLEKVALEGPCCKAQPITFKVSARAKWYAWQKLGNMSREMAMENYINILSKVIPEWKVESTTPRIGFHSCKVNKIRLTPNNLLDYLDFDWSLNL